MNVNFSYLDLTTRKTVQYVVWNVQMQFIKCQNQPSYGFGAQYRKRGNRNSLLQEQKCGRRQLQKASSVLGLSDIGKYLANTIFQQDAALRPFSVLGRLYLDQMYPNCWIDRAIPISWPTHSRV